MDQTRGLAFVLVVIWTSILVALASQPLARGEAHSCGYNYRPWQPKFAKSPTDEEADMVGRRFAQFAIDCTLLTIGLGVLAVILGLLPE